MGGRWKEGRKEAISGGERDGCPEGPAEQGVEGEEGGGEEEGGEKELADLQVFSAQEDSGQCCGFQECGVEEVLREELRWAEKRRRGGGNEMVGEGDGERKIW